MSSPQRTSLRILPNEATFGLKMRQPQVVGSGFYVGNVGSTVWAFGSTSNLRIFVSAIWLVLKNRENHRLIDALLKSLIRYSPGLDPNGRGVYLEWTWSVLVDDPTGHPVTVNRAKP